MLPISSKQFTKSKRKGFTLVEILVVISIIALLTTIILVSIDRTKSTSKDARSIADMKELQSAIQQYGLSTGKLPVLLLCNPYSNALFIVDNENEYNSVLCGNNHPSVWTCDREPPDWGLFVTQSFFGAQDNAWNKTMQPLVDAGFLKSIPHSQPGTYPYCYFNYPNGIFSSSTDKSFALLATRLITYPAATSGPLNSFRFDQTHFQLNWQNHICNTSAANTSYCLQVFK